MTTSGVTVVVALSLLPFGCATSPRIDTRTAVDFEREAQAHRSHAALARQQNNIWQTTQPALGASDAMREAQLQPGPGVFSPDLYAAGRVTLDEKAAADDEKIAQRLRNEAEVSCSRVPSDQRVWCPDGGEHSKRVAIPGGVRIELPSGDAESITRVVQCAVAQAHVERPDGAERCPLLVAGAFVRVVGNAIEITSDEPGRVDQIRKAAALPPAR